MNEPICRSTRPTVKLAPMSGDPDQPTPAEQRAVRKLVEELLSQRWPQARLVATAAIPGDASTRRYLRCRLERPAGPHECPHSLIVMLMRDAAMARSSEELGVFGEQGPEEVPFLNVGRFLAGICDAVPEVFAVSRDQTIVLLEDLGDISLWERASSQRAQAEALFEQALSLLAGLQAAAVDDGSGCYAFAQHFDERLFNWELKEFLDYGVAGASLGELDMAVAELEETARQLALLPRVFCHRDYHAWNIHVQNGRLRVFDFQDALMGPALYDVASLLTDRCTPELITETTERNLVLRFYREQGRGGLDSEENTLAAYRLCALQRTLKVLGRFNQLAEVKGKTGYLHFLPSVAATARRLIAQIPNMGAVENLLHNKVKVPSATVAKAQQRS